MKLLHTADLHIGKTMYEFPLYEDQAYILNQILEIARKEQVDVLLLAGDIYDRSIPSTEAVTVFDEFLTACVKEGIVTMVISGNHDSPERLSFGGRLFEENRLYIAGTWEGQVKQVTLEDEYGEVDFFLLPFVRPGQLQARTEGEGVEKIMKEAVSLDKGKRNVLMTHYFVGGKNCEPELSESENTVYVGGIDMVSPALFEEFDYVALGHLHKAQKVGKNHVYYAGSPLAYSFSENSSKTVQLVELLKPGEVVVKKVPLKPLRQVRTVEGDLWELTKEQIAALENREDYIRAVLTNEEALMEPMAVLRSVYPNAMEIILKEKELANVNQRRQQITRKKKSGIELFRDFYTYVEEKDMSEKQLAAAEEMMDKALMK
ncbi:MAG: exonuclease SbcCD subunit D [Lachnospiraceae bacterium]|nr:exonuclease SbcCD subunit D [Lachnospiraceae bacterium]